MDSQQEQQKKLPFKTREWQSEQDCYDRAQRHLQMLFKPQAGIRAVLCLRLIFDSALFRRVLRHDPKIRIGKTANRLILSAGHKAPALYAVLGEAG